MDSFRKKISRIIIWWSVVLECGIAPVADKYENSTLYDILVNPEVQIRKNNMMILKAGFEGKIIGAKVYSVSDKKTGLSIL